MHARSWVRGGCIGKGSFGEVSLAVDRTDGRVFAVKSIDLNSAPPLAVAALENEIRILRSLDSPHVVSYLGDDFTESGRRRNLHLEYLGGGTLAAVASSAKLLERDVRAHARSITRALQYLHSSAGLVHGDVKGRNVLLCSETGVGKLADFGSARRIFGEAGTAGGAGTPLWMAPEVARGEAAMAASDVWSLGCTVIEMAGGGRPPWGELGRDVDAATQMFRIGFSASLPEFPSRMSKTAQDFLDKCLRRDPAERWTCEQLLQHPFLTEPTAEIGPSPRSVQDWANLDPEVEEDDDDDDDLERRGRDDASPESARRRLHLLASEPSTFSANWTYDGWVEVRMAVAEEAGKTELEARETSSEYPECLGLKREETETPVASGLELSNREKNCRRGFCVLCRHLCLGRRRSLVRVCVLHCLFNQCGTSKTLFNNGFQTSTYFWIISFYILIFQFSF